MPQDILLAVRLCLRKACRTVKSVEKAPVPPTGTLCSALHCGQMRLPFCPDFSRIRSRQPLQNVWQHGSTLGCLKSSRHTLHVRSLTSCSFSAILLWSRKPDFSFCQRGRNVWEPAYSFLVRGIWNYFASRKRNANSVKLSHDSAFLLAMCTSDASSCSIVEFDSKRRWRKQSQVTVSLNVRKDSVAETLPLPVGTHREAQTSSLNCLVNIQVLDSRFTH